MSYAHIVKELLFRKDDCNKTDLKGRTCLHLAVHAGDGEMIVGDGSGDPVAESGATLRTSIGLGTGDSPTFTDLTLTGGDITLTAGATDIDLIDNNANIPRGVRRSSRRRS